MIKYTYIGLTEIIIYADNESDRNWALFHRVKLDFWKYKLIE